MALVSKLIDAGYELNGVTRFMLADGSGELDRTKYVSASEAGRCSRDLAYTKRFTEQPTGGGRLKNWGYAERGNIIEEWQVALIRLALLSYPDLALLYAGEEQVSFTKGFQSGTPDGLLVDLKKGTGICLEFKSYDPRANTSYFPKDMHIEQIQQNIWLMDNETEFDVKSGILVYTNASNLQEKIEFELDADPEMHKQQQMKARSIMTALDPNKLPPEGILNDGCRFCAFTDVCSGAVEQSKKAERDQRIKERMAGNVFK